MGGGTKSVSVHVEAPAKRWRSSGRGLNRCMAEASAAHMAPVRGKVGHDVRGVAGEAVPGSYRARGKARPSRIGPSRGRVPRRMPRRALRVHREGGRAAQRGRG